jgi:predicted O-methyltransferase YrrM
VPAGGRLLEFGTWTGAAAAWIADQRPDVEIVSVDNFAFCPQNLALWQSNQRPNMTLFVGTTAYYCVLSRPGAFDAVLVDADHKEPGVAADLRRAAVVVTPGGSIFAHDYGCPDWPGVKRAVDAFCAAEGWTNLGGIATLVRLIQR